MFCEPQSAVYGTLRVSCPVMPSTLHALCSVPECMLHLLLDLAV